MDTQIDIADLVKPKFLPREEVFRVSRDHNNDIVMVKKVRIESVHFRVRFECDCGQQVRKTTLEYVLCSGEGTAWEGSLYKNFDDIPEKLL